VLNLGIINHSWPFNSYFRLVLNGTQGQDQVQPEPKGEGFS